MLSDKNERPVIAQAALLSVAAYIACQIIADIASLKIGVVFGLAVDMGTFIYPFTFTLRDVVHREVGRKNARLLVVAAGAINLFMALYFWISARVPSDPSYAYGEAFAAVLAPVWRIVVASIVAEIASELADTEMYHWFTTKITMRHKWARVLVSNGVSIPIDNAIFAVGAFAFTLPWPVVGQIFIANLVVKFAVTIVSIPLIYIGGKSKTGAA